MTTRIQAMLLCLGFLAIGCSSEPAEDPRSEKLPLVAAGGCKFFILSLMESTQDNLKSKQREQAAAYVEEVLPSMAGYVEGVAGSEYEETVKQLDEKLKQLQQTLAGSDDPKSAIEEIKSLAASLPDPPAL